MDALTPIQFHILAALVDTPRHGYAIMREAEARSSGAVKVGAGTLYTALRRMLEDGLIEEVDRPPRGDGSDDERRRYYRLTAQGLASLKAEARRLDEMVRYARSKKLIVARAT
jgi:DNA-binding PadR family transcriptional regulator